VAYFHGLGAGVWVSGFSVIGREDFLGLLGYSNIFVFGFKEPLDWCKIIMIADFYHLLHLAELQ
tara:strand:- start:98 stop:289 length:192 start_codon:yes stop_codon:yes gene_type:complete